MDAGYAQDLTRLFSTKTADGEVQLPLVLHPGYADCYLRVAEDHMMRSLPCKRDAVIATSGVNPTESELFSGLADRAVVLDGRLLFHFEGLWLVSVNRF